MSKIIPTIADLHQSADKSNIVELAEDHAQQILDSDYDLTTTYVALKRYEVYLKTLIKQLQPPTTKLILEHGAPPKDYAHAKIIVTRRRRYDFSQDETWLSAQEEMKRLKAFKKQREQFLKNIQTEFIEEVDESTGEVRKVFAPSVTEKDGITVRL